MAWLKGDDKAHGNPKLRAVAGVSKTAGFGILFCWLYAAQQSTNGWLPQWVVEREFTAKELDAVTTIKANGRAPLIHTKGAECSCLHGLEWTDEMGGYWIHDWLKHNPSKAENTVHRAKGRELGDKDLRTLIMKRDGNSCRYCGIVVPWNDKKSPRMLTIDHVNPTLAVGAANLVVACTTCNSRKKDATTPEAAGLTLLPPPIDPPIEWPKGTDPASIERAEPEPITDQIDPESPDIDPDSPVIGSRSDHRSDLDQTGDPQPGDSPVENQADQAKHTARASPDTTTGGLPPQRGGDGSGSRTPPDTGLTHHAGDVGPRGRRKQVGPATTPRSADNPPTYRKTATSNPPPPPAQEGPP
jgi:hypothetical protein